MNKREREEYILGLAQPLLRLLYGDFEVDSRQTDRPDAAIDVHKPRKQLGRGREQFSVGIEITTVDKQDMLAYFNDQKFGKELMIGQVMDAIESGSDTAQPQKKSDILISHSYIYDGVADKAPKYQDYAKSGKFREVILLCFSEVISTRGEIFTDGLRDWTNHLLSKNNFPFDKVLFVDAENNAVKIFDRNQPMLQAPAAFRHEGSTVTRLNVFKLVGEGNLNDSFSQPPLIAPRSRTTAS